MPRRPRLATGDLAYHVLNRRVGRLPLFEKPSDYSAFERILAESVASTRLRIAAYSLMPNHWHLLIWPRRDGELSEVLRWITVTQKPVIRSDLVSCLTFDRKQPMCRASYLAF